MFALLGMVVAMLLYVLWAVIGDPLLGLISFLSAAFCAGAFAQFVKDEFF